MHCAKIKNRDVNIFKYLQNPILDNFYHGFTRKEIQTYIVGLWCAILAFPCHTHLLCLRNEFNFWNVHGIMNTSGLLQSK